MGFINLVKIVGGVIVFCVFGIVLLYGVMSVVGGVDGMVGFLVGYFIVWIVCGVIVFVVVVIFVFVLKIVFIDWMVEVEIVFVV